MIMSFARRAAFLAMLSLPVSAAHADEGMWTFDAFPAAKMQADYGWAPDQAWLDKVRAAAVRLTGGCSASFVSGERPDPHQPPLRRVAALEQNFDRRATISSKTGFTAAHPRRGEEVRRPAGRGRHRDHATSPRR